MKKQEKGSAGSSSGSHDDFRRRGSGCVQSASWGISIIRIPAAVPASAPRKRGAEDPSGPEAVPQESSTNAGMEQDALVDPLARPGGAKRLGEEYPKDGYQAVEEAKQQKINLVEIFVETMEDETIKIATLDGKIQMRICGEAVDFFILRQTKQSYWKRQRDELTLEESFLN